MSDNWQTILRDAGYPTTAVTLDFETYFDKDYSLKNLSNVEFICDPRFAFTGLGVFISKMPFDDEENCWFVSPTSIGQYIRRLQKVFGKNLEHCTLVGQNLMFDALILTEKFGIIPKYTIDVLNLARHEDSRRSNKLEKLCEYYDVGVKKGDTSQFKGLHWEEMSPTQQKNMVNYCRGDIISETRLFRLLLPLLTNPSLEIPLQQHTLELYLRPRLAFDFDLADKLQGRMEDELITVLNKVSWVLEYEN